MEHFAKAYSDIIKFNKYIVEKNFIVFFNCELLIDIKLNDGRQIATGTYVEQISTPIMMFLETKDGQLLGEFGGC